MKELYNSNIESTQIEIASLRKQINVNSLLRLGVILVGGAFLFQVFQWNNVWLLLVSVFVILIAFVALVRRQSALEKKLENKNAFLRVNENEIKVSDQNKNMYLDGEVYNDSRHPYVSDLDIFGPHSLFVKINRAATHDGVERLAKWLLSAATKDVIEGRQEASTELSEKISWSQNFQSKLLFNLDQKTNIRHFLTQYFNDSILKFGNAFMRRYVPIAPFLLLFATIVSIFVMPLWSYIGGLCLVHLLWTLALAGKVSYFSNRIDKIGQTLIAYSDSIRMVENEDFKSRLTLNLQKSLRISETKLTSDSFNQLGRLIDKLDARNNMLIGSILNIIFLWDFKQVMAIVEWKKNYETNILDSFDVIAEMEALISLGTLKRNQPDWIQPILDEDTQNQRIRAKSLSHPLISADKAVANDYDAQSHQIALVTGSNMAGKSTFLRTVGINAVLAYAGSVVYASEFRLPIYRLVSYMRIKDNLNESTSTFKAEIDRMKFILGMVDVAKDSFFLIDEMLRGTNSVDKYLGSRAIIEKLIQMEGKGMVATHDLQLATLEEMYPAYIKNYHFDIQVVDGEMLFDYKLKNGKCTVFNASMLLKGIGIDVAKV